MSASPSITINDNKHKTRPWFWLVGLLIAAAIGLHECQKGSTGGQMAQTQGTHASASAPARPVPAIEPGTPCMPFATTLTYCEVGAEGTQTIPMAAAEAAAHRTFCFGPYDPNLYQKVEYLDINGQFQLFDFAHPPTGAIGGYRFFPKKKMVIRYQASDGPCS